MGTPTRVDDLIASYSSKGPTVVDAVVKPDHSLRKAIRHAAAVVLVASPSARGSRYVKDELRIAEMYKRPVYPLWAMGNEWMDAVPIGWGGTQYIDAREERYQEAIHEMVMILEKLNSPADAADAGPEPGPLQSEPPRNPYKGLHAFRREDAGDFFGRSRFINALVEALQKQLATEEQGASRARLLTVIGSSGSGKSSVCDGGSAAPVTARRSSWKPGVGVH